MSGTIVTLAQLNLPDGFWKAHGMLQWVSVITLAAIILIDASNEVTFFVRARQIRDYDNDVRAALSAAASRVITDSGIAWDQIAVRYYHRRNWIRRHDLAPVAAVMAGADLDERRRPIRAGTGIVGTAFEAQEIVIEEWYKFARKATAEGRASWDKRSKAPRYSLTWGQLQNTSRPAAVLASPTFAPTGTPNGCILVSGALKISYLESDEMRRILEYLATTLDQIGPPPAGWWRAHER